MAETAGADASRHGVPVDLVALRATISRIIDQLGGDSYEQRFARNAWTVSRGSASGLVALLEDTRRPGASAIVVSFPIMKVPEHRSALLYQRLLEMNRALMGRASFAVGDGAVTLMAARPAAGADAGELSEFIGWTAEVADHYDDVLLGEFGRELRLAGPEAG
jgi:hypothetical protein